MVTIISWTGGDGDNSQDPASWSPNQVPASGTIAYVAVATPGTLTEPFGANLISYPIDGPVYFNGTFNNQLVELGGPATPGAAAPGIDFIPYDTDSSQYDVGSEYIGTGVTIAELGQTDNVNFIAVAPNDGDQFLFAGLMESDVAGGTLDVTAQGNTFIYSTLDLNGVLEAAAGGLLDIDPVEPSIVGFDTLGTSFTFSPDLVVNEAVIEALAGGTVRIDKENNALVNSGSIVAAGGAVLIDTSVEESSSLITESGSGALYIANGVIDVLDPADVISENVVFQSAGTLILASQGGELASPLGIAGFAPGDTLELPGNTLSGLRYSSSNDTLSYARTTGGATYDGSIAIAGSQTSKGFVVTDNGAGITLACFARGTNLLTEAGPVAVEALAVGQRLVTAGGALRPIRWLGHRDTVCEVHPNPQQVWPVRVAAHAFGSGRPCRDLFLSPEHAVHDCGVLVPIRTLVNGVTVAQQPVARIEYWHVELDSHDILLAEGLPAESYLDTRNRAAFANGGAVAQLQPDFAGGDDCHLIWEASGAAPLRIAGPEVASIRTKLRRRARRLGHVVPPSPRPVRPRHDVSDDLATLLRPRWYLAANPDVAASGLDPIVHYRSWGRGEGRLPCAEADLLRGLGMVDDGMLAFGLDDLVLAGLDPAVHYASAGWREDRRLNPYFDAAWYRARHGVAEDVNPLLHYLLCGEARGFAPGRHFDPAWYRRHYSLAPTQSPLAHYLAHRRTWRVAPNPAFDLASYIRANGARLLPGRDVFAHFLMSGHDAAVPAVSQDRFPWDRGSVSSGLRAHARAR